MKFLEVFCVCAVWTVFVIWIYEINPKVGIGLIAWTFAINYYIDHYKEAKNA